MLLAVAFVVGCTSMICGLSDTFRLPRLVVVVVVVVVLFIVCVGGCRCGCCLLLFRHLLLVLSHDDMPVRYNTLHDRKVDGVD